MSTINTVIYVLIYRDPGNPLHVPGISQNPFKALKKKIKKNPKKITKTVSADSNEQFIQKTINLNHLI